MKIEWNRVTWYSKVFAVILFVAVFYVGFSLGQKKSEIVVTTDASATKKVSAPASVISITTKKIKEENFSGSMPVITGSGTLATKAREYVNAKISEFRKQANADVPDIRAKFGAETPTANYEIDIEAKYEKSSKTESVVISVYEYTGGANGNSSYRVITASLSSGKVLALSDVIKKEKQSDFVSLVKKELTTWSPDGSDTAVIFKDDVDSLTFSAFKNWSLNDENLLVYFDKYDIGPGALGAVAFPISLDKVNSFLTI